MQNTRLCHEIAKLKLKLELTNAMQNVKCVHIIKVRALFAENKVRFARAEQLCSELTSSQTNTMALKLYKFYVSACKFFIDLNRSMKNLHALTSYN